MAGGSLSIIPRLQTRQRMPELMDDPSLDRPRHEQALAGLVRVNAVSGSARMLWREIRRFARQTGARRLRLLDVATGGGDVPLRLARLARRANFDLEVEACDISPQALAYAARRAEAARAAVRFFPLDILREEIAQTYDIVTCLTFLHHLDEADCVQALQRMRRATRGLLLVNDLRRSTLGLLVAYWGVRVLSRSEIAHVDGPRSVRAAFTIPETRALAAQAGLAGATVTPRWPWRMLLSWKAT